MQSLTLCVTFAEEKLLYKEGGPNAAATFDAGYEGFAARAYRGMGVVTSDPVRCPALIVSPCPRLTRC
jgi:hypothetical protein